MVIGDWVYLLHLTLETSQNLRLLTDRLDRQSSQTAFSNQSGLPFDRGGDSGSYISTSLEDTPMQILTHPADADSSCSMIPCHTSE
jgi:hypothetical protein